MYPYIFNHFWDIAVYRWRVTAWFSTVLVSEWAFFNQFAFPWVRPWDNRGKCYMDRKRNQYLSNASQHVPIYLQPFLRYSELLVENCDIFRPHLCLAAPQGVTPSEFRKDLDIHKTSMNGLSFGEESMTIRSAVLIQCQRVTDGQTDRRTDVQPISITCFSIADARKRTKLAILQCSVARCSTPCHRQLSPLAAWWHRHTCVNDLHSVRVCVCVCPPNQNYQIHHQAECITSKSTQAILFRWVDYLSRMHLVVGSKPKGD